MEADEVAERPSMRSLIGVIVAVLISTGSAFVIWPSRASDTWRAMLTWASPISASAGTIEIAMEAYNRKDYATALQLLRPLAQQGDPRAPAVLGLMYMRGQGVQHDDLEAVDWFRKAAEQGDSMGEAWLGFSYFVGFAGVPEDRAEALRWYRKAAKQGNAVGEAGLGMMFMYGVVVPHDYDQAAMWFRKAAEQGDAEAQNDLGAAYEYGHGVPKDFVLAYMWESLASTSELNVAFPAGLARDRLAKQMTPEQIAEAQRLTREWKPTK
jgi:TPR repeat protein